jgi:hypothetical protein
MNKPKTAKKKQLIFTNQSEQFSLRILVLFPQNETNSTAQNELR